MSSKPSILFMGTPEFARVCLENLCNQGFPIKAVFSQPDKPAGRGRENTTPPVAQFAKDHALPLFQPTRVKDPEVIKTIQGIQADFIIVAAYGFLLPQEILNASKIETINVHGSLLPHYRGAAPVQWALINGEKTTGISIMKMVQKMDAGPVFSQKEVAIEQADTTKRLMDKLAAAGAALLIETLPGLASGKLISIAQDETHVTFAPPLKKEDGKMDWAQEASKILCRIRGVTPWPGAHTFVDNKMLKIYDASVLAEETKALPGSVIRIGPEGISIACGCNTSLCLKEVQLEGKNRMPGADFARGYRLKTGQIFQ